MPPPGRRMSSPRELLQQLLERRNLSESQAQELLVQLADAQLPAAMSGAILAALHRQGRGRG